ncbi:MAG TPA: extensin family protein [Bosea sp. (in: a-proteobacteria)]
MAFLSAFLLSPTVAWPAQPRGVWMQLPPRRPAELPARPQSEPPATQPKPGAASEPVAASQPDAPADSRSDAACLAALIAAHGSDVRPAKVEPGQDAACSVVEPVVVEALTSGVEPKRQRIVLQPPVTLSCAMATSVAQWLETSVRPLAKGYFERDLTGLRVGGGHECRRRNRATNGPLSEHSTGRALDIFGFVIGDGRDGESVVVEKPDGALQRGFLAAVRQSACGAFMTALGPGSDAAHANHLHVDTQPRRAVSSRFCQ